MSKFDTPGQRANLRIRRSAPAAAGNLVTVGTPTAITLCQAPANQRPYQVVRSDSSEGSGIAAPVPRVVRTKRSVNPVLGLTFPAGTDQAGAEAILAAFDMSDYTLMVDDAGVYTAIRSDLQSIATETTDIKLNKDGVIARVDASTYKITRSESKDNLALVALEFDVQRFDADKVSTWLVENKVDRAQETVENPDNKSLTVKRSEVEDGTDVRKVQLDDGVTAVITRADVADVPAGFADSVNEAMYGNWGWGHLDFSASMADVEYSRMMDEANYRLTRVLENITLYSQLPLEQRKALVDRALAQYADFVKSVIDALPRQVMLLVTRAAEQKEKEPMSDKEKGAQATDTPVTRSELSTLIAEGIATAFAAQRAEQTQAAPATTPAATQPSATEVVPGLVQRGATLTIENPVIVAPAAAASTDTQNITRGDLNAALTEMLAPLVEKINNTVVVRSDAGETVVTAPDAAKANEPLKRGDTKVYSGMLAGLRRNSSAAS